MPTVRVLIEVEAQQPAAFESFGTAMRSASDAMRQASSLLDPLAGLGVDLREDVAPVPMFIGPDEPGDLDELARADTVRALRDFSSPETNPDQPSATVVVPAEVDLTRLEEVAETPGVRVWPDSELVLLDRWGVVSAAGSREDAAAADESGDMVAFDLARSRTGTDCRPFRSAATIGTIRALLGVSRVWNDGFRGQNVVVGILDEGIDGTVYPVTGGLRRPGAPAPGTAPITSHGSMCAADVLIAAPAARLYDYPFLGQPRSGGALAMFQAVLEQRRVDGTPHLTNNSYGFTGVPPRIQAPNHEIHDINHPLHRKVREVIASGAAAFFAAGNCGAPCASGNCHPSGIGPAKSIHASNSLAEVVTIAAVNSRHERIGYSSQGPGMFEPQKPDLASYSHILANFGPGRPGGTADQPFDNGTSAATPVACGVAALLLSAFPDTTPQRLKAALTRGAMRVGAAPWDAEYGRGIVNAAVTYRVLERDLV